MRLGDIIEVDLGTGRFLAQLDGRGFDQQQPDHLNFTICRVEPLQKFRDENANFMFGTSRTRTSFVDYFVCVFILD